MYSIFDHASMVGDRPRMGAYVPALRRAVGPESVVLDLGAGTGIFSLLACQFGARRVYAVECDDVIEIARELVRVNGYAERVVFVEGVSTEIELPERVDVIVSDLQGILPLFARNLPCVIDARDRFLKPGGTLIPSRESLWTAPIQAPGAHDWALAPWRDERFGLDMSPVRRLVVNTFWRQAISPDQCIAAPRCWSELDFHGLTGPDVRGAADWRVDRKATVHGFGLWFDAQAADELRFSNAPGEPPTIFGQCVAPLETPVEVDAGDTISVRFQANLVGGDYVWRWETEILSAAERPAVKAACRQTSFYGQIVSATKLRRGASKAVPVLSERGEVDRFILLQMDGRASVEQIATNAASAFPDRLDPAAALQRVVELAQRCAR
jgi:type I protein arginine methyltransferase